VTAIDIYPLAEKGIRGDGSVVGLSRGSSLKGFLIIILRSFGGGEINGLRDV
jgi:hypothetical protein